MWMWVNSFHFELGPKESTSQDTTTAADTQFTEEYKCAVGANGSPKFVNPRKKSRIWLGTCNTPEMAARVHDVAAFTIKGDSAILNFPRLSHSLPRPHSVSPRDIQAAAAKAAAMADLNSYSSSSSSSSLSVVDSSDELAEIIELPSLEGCFGSALSRTDFLLVDRWLYPTWWVTETDFDTYFSQQSTGYDYDCETSFKDF